MIRLETDDIVLEETEELEISIGPDDCYALAQQLAAHVAHEMNNCCLRAVTANRIIQKTRGIYATEMLFMADKCDYPEEKIHGLVAVADLLNYVASRKEFKKRADETVERVCNILCLFSGWYASYLQLQATLDGKGRGESVRAREQAKKYNPWPA